MHNTVAARFHAGQMIEGEVGIEVELEGENLPTNIPKLSSQSKKHWTVTNDGSLRGDAYEYVLAAPVVRKEVDEALDQLYRKLDSATLLDSGRAGVHVHINVREMTMTQMFTFALLYLVFEKVLVKFCGESREGNLFCLRISDAEYLSMALTNAIKTSRFDRLSSDDLRYASINFTALRKYGSLEFRAMRSPVSKEVIKQWVDILLSLKDAALRFNDPEELMLGVSSHGGYDFARQNLGASIEVLGDVNWNVEVIAGLRLIQPIVKVLSERHKEPVKEELPKPVEDLGRMADDMRRNTWAPIEGMAFRDFDAPQPVPATTPNQRQLRIRSEMRALPNAVPNSFYWMM